MLASYRGVSEFNHGFISASTPLHSRLSPCKQHIITSQDLICALALGSSHSKENKPLQHPRLDAIIGQAELINTLKHCSLRYILIISFHPYLNHSSNIFWFRNQMYAILYSLSDATVQSLSWGSPTPNHHKYIHLYLDATFDKLWWCYLQERCKTLLDIVGQYNRLKDTFHCSLSSVRVSKYQKVWLLKYVT